MPAQHIVICDIGKQASVATQRHWPGAQNLAPASSNGCEPVHIGPPPSHAQTGVVSQQLAAVVAGKHASFFWQ
jgi:hypothetical protein